MPSLGGSDSKYGGDDYGGNDVASSSTDGVGGSDSGGLSGHDGRSTYSSGFTTNGSLSDMGNYPERDISDAVKSHVAETLGWTNDAPSPESLQKAAAAAQGFRSRYDQDRWAPGKARDKAFDYNRVPDMDDTLVQTAGGTLADASLEDQKKVSDALNTGNYQIDENGKIVDDRVGQMIDVGRGLGGLISGGASLMTGNPVGGLVSGGMGVKTLAGLSSNENYLEGKGFHDDGDGRGRSANRGSMTASAEGGRGLSSLGGGQGGNGNDFDTTGYDPATGLLPIEGTADATPEEEETTTAEAESTEGSDRLTAGIEKLNMLAGDDGVWAQTASGLTYTPNFFSFSDPQEHAFG